jgi:hypothetical protein
MVSLKRDLRPAEARRHYVLLDRRFEVIAVRDRNPVGIVCSFDEFRRLWIAGNPQLYWLVISSKSAAMNVRFRIGGVFVRPNALQD